MFPAVAGFELRYQLKSPVFWVTASVLPASAFVADRLATTIQIGWGGNVMRNSPYTIAQTCMIMSVFAIFIVDDVRRQRR